MGSEELKKVVILGNPNAGKSSLFNALTGLNQRIGNFPGVTVEKKTGRFKDAQTKQYSKPSFLLSKNYRCQSPITTRNLL